MKMRLTTTVLIIFLGLWASSEAFQNFPYEDCWPHMQPNYATFMARMWGAGLIVEYETSGGYTITYGPNGYMHYATLDSTGEYTPSDSIVAVNGQPTTCKSCRFILRRHYD